MRTFEACFERAMQGGHHMVSYLWGLGPSTSFAKTSGPALHQDGEHAPPALLAPSIAYSCRLWDFSVLHLHILFGKSSRQMLATIIYTLVDIQKV